MQQVAQVHKRANTMKKGLRVSPQLVLPTDAITQTFVVYGAKGKGKTNFGVVLAEELYENDLKFSALDPYGVMYGLRYGQTKSETGIEILIIGGTHGDLQILPSSGAVVADLVADEPISTVVDISRGANGKMWTKGEKIRFVADYATRLFERQGEHRRPLMQIIDEAGRYCPQMIPHGSPELARCVGAIEELVEVGRNVGIGVTLITQRSARMNKSVSELAECMVAFCTLGPNSVEAITDWCGEHIEKARWKEIVGQLRTLPRGTAMVVSPGWLGLEGQTVEIRARWTYDSSATPKAGQGRSTPGAKGAIPDLAKYREKMAEVETQAKASDPREQRRQLAERDRRIAELEAAAEKAPLKTKVETIARDIFDEKRWQACREIITNALLEVSGRTNAALDRYESAARERAKHPLKLVTAPKSPPIEPGEKKKLSTLLNEMAPGVRAVARGSLAPTPDDVTLESLGKGAGKMLVAIAQHTEGVTPEQLMILTDYKATSRDTYVQRLTTNGFATRTPDRNIHITSKGWDALGPDFTPLPTGNDLRDYYLRTLPEGEKRILRAVVNVYPNSLTKAELMERTSYKATSVDTYAQRLRVRKLIKSDRGVVVASETLFS